MSHIINIEIPSDVKQIYQEFLTLQDKLYDMLSDDEEQNKKLSQSINALKMAQLHYTDAIFDYIK